MTKPPSKRPRRGTSSLIIGRPGAGKSTLLHTLPSPRLIVDAESGDDEFEGNVNVIPWEEYEEEGENPAMFTANTSVVIDATDYEGFSLGMSVVRADRKRVFKGFGLDTVSRIQEHMEEELTPLNRRSLKAKETTYSHFRALRDYMRADLVYLHELTKQRGLVTAWACQVDTESEPIGPRLVGALRQSIPDIPDIVGFLRVEEGQDAKGNPAIWRVLDIASVEGGLALAKCRRRKVATKYGREIPNPNLARIASVASPRPGPTRKSKTKKTTKE